MESKENVREFYDQIGWKLESDGFYQNARYEDLRPVSAEYIHRCHLRITPVFAAGGDKILDLGSGPIQYPEYLTYSEKFNYRVCCDISLTALQEARTRIGDHGLFVVGDAANLPFAPETLDGIVSLHTLHHLDLSDQEKAWSEIWRTLKPGGKAAVVNGWTESVMMQRWQPLVRLAERIGHRIAVLRGKETAQPKKVVKTDAAKPTGTTSEAQPTGTFVRKMTAEQLRKDLAKVAPTAKVTISCWRSVSVRWLRALIHAPYGKVALRLLFRRESEQPTKYGEEGQYPLIVVEKSAVESD